ncbi:hypothetical protein PLESTM_000549700 [Pleodorina starrii]|nr:hypothetical protein PLESTM_000549700 [Pleodorina starrii]
MDSLLNLGALLRVRPALRTSQELKEIKTQLQQCPFFAGWADESLTQISGVLGCASFASGEKVTEPGEAVYSIFILLSGSCDLAVPHPTDPRVAPQHRPLHPGDVCGREAVLSHDPRARGRVTAGPSGALLATLSNSAWADICARATTGSAAWLATRADLLCAFLRQLVWTAPATGPAAASGSRQSVRQQSQQQRSGEREGPGGGSAGVGGGGGGGEGGQGRKGTAGEELAAAAAATRRVGEAEGEGEGDGPAEALRLELVAVLLASLPSAMAAMPQRMLQEAAKGCRVRVVPPYGVLHSGSKPPAFQAVLLSGEVQVRKFPPEPAAGGPPCASAASSRRSLLTGFGAGSSKSALTAAAAAAAVAATSPVAQPAARRDAGRPSASAEGRGGGGGRAAAIAATKAAAVESESLEGVAGLAGGSGSGEAGGEGEGQGQTEGEGGEGVPTGGTSGESSAEGEEEEEEEDDDEDAAAAGEGDEEEEERLEEGEAEGDEEASLSAEEAEGRLTERFGPVVATETRGSVLLELPLASIARRGKWRRCTGSRASPEAAAAVLTAGAAPASLLIVPLAALRRGYEAARAALVAARVALLGGCRPLNSALNAAELAELALAARPLWLTGGAVVARQGNPVEALYLVQEGEVRLLDDPDGAAHHHHHHHHHHHLHHQHHQHHHLHHQHHHLHHQHHQHPEAKGSSSASSASSASSPLALAGSRGSHSSLLLAAFLEDPVLGSEGAKPPWVVTHSHSQGHGHGHGHGHGQGHGHSYGHGHGHKLLGRGAAAGVAGGSAASLDLSAAMVQRSLAHLTPLMLLEPGGLLGESVLGYLPTAEEQPLEPREGGGGGVSAEEGPSCTPSTPQFPPAAPQPAPPAPPLAPAPPTALPAATTARSPLQHRHSVQRSVASDTATAVTATAATSPAAAAAVGATALFGEPAPPPDQQQMLPVLQQEQQQQQPHPQQRPEETPQHNGDQDEQRQQLSSQQTQQQQPQTDGHNHHKQMQHLHRLLTKYSQDHLSKPTDNHHNHHNHNHNHHYAHGQPPADVLATRMSTDTVDQGAVHAHAVHAAHRRASMEIPAGSTLSQPHTRARGTAFRSSLEILTSAPSPPHTSLSSPSTPTGHTAASAAAAGAAPTPALRASTTSQSSAAGAEAPAGDGGGAAAVAAAATAAAAAAAGEATAEAAEAEADAARRGVFPATAVAVGAVRLLAIPREALLRLPQLQRVLAALASGQLRILEQRRRAAQKTRDRLQAAAAAAAAADGAASGAAAAAVAKDPYAETHRQKAERRAAVGALSSGAAALRAPEVRPTGDMLARPSVILEKMGFKVPKVRGLLAAGSPSRRASEQPSPLLPPPLLTATSSPSSSQLEGLFFVSQSNSPKSPAARISTPTGELALLGGLTARSHSVTPGAFGGSAAAAALAKLPALPRYSSGAMDFDTAAAAAAAASPPPKPPTRGGGGGGMQLLSAGRETSDALRGTTSLPEHSTTSFSIGGTYSTPLPRISTDEFRTLRGSSTGSARGERTNPCGGGGGGGGGGPVLPDPRSNSGSPMRRSPRVYDMDAFAAASAANSRAGSFSGAGQGQHGGLLARAVFGAPPPLGVELLSSAGSPRSLSPVPPPAGADAAEMHVRTVSFSNLGRLALPSATLDDGPPGSSLEEGRLPALPSPQRPSRMFQEEAAAAATAALLRGHAAGGAAAPPAQASPGGKAPLPPGDPATVSRWMQEHVSGNGNGSGGGGGGGSALLRRTLQGGQSQSPGQQPLAAGLAAATAAALQKAPPPSSSSASASAASSLDAQAAEAALRLGSLTSL